MAQKRSMKFTPLPHAYKHPYYVCTSANLLILT